jgi:DNA-directed RNA polymerase subunit RPC12/RpoP
MVLITETECVYCSVRTGSLNIILRSAHTVYLCVLCWSQNKQRLFPYTALTDWFDNRDGVCLLRGTDWVFKYNSTFCTHSVFMCFVWISEQTVIISLYSITWLVFITETECVYCAVRTESLNITQSVKLAVHSTLRHVCHFCAYADTMNSTVACYNDQ